MANFRSILHYLAPGWLYNPDEPADGVPVDDGTLVLHSLAWLVDAFTQRALAGLEARLPTRAGAAALSQHGKDRGIPRGREETAAHYVARLIAWRYPRGHRVRGGAPALLEQVSEYFGGVRCWTIDKSGNRYTRDADGTWTVEHGVAWDWDGEAVTPLWAKFWLGIDVNPDMPDVVAWPTFGEGIEGKTFGEAAAAGYVWGHQGISFQDVRAIKRLFHGSNPWKPLHASEIYAVVTLEDHAVAGYPEPDGLWGSAAGRDPTRRYWNLRDY